MYGYTLPSTAPTDNANIQYMDKVFGYAELPEFDDLPSCQKTQMQNAQQFQENTVIPQNFDMPAAEVSPCATDYRQTDCREVAKATTREDVYVALQKIYTAIAKFIYAIKVNSTTSTEALALLSYVKEELLSHVMWALHRVVRGGVNLDGVSCDFNVSFESDINSGMLNEGLLEYNAFVRSLAKCLGDIRSVITDPEEIETIEQVFTLTDGTLTLVQSNVKTEKSIQSKNGRKIRSATKKINRR